MENLENWKLKKNTITSIISQLVTIICGLILPRLILITYGSKVNGLVNSITQFLSLITFLELGIGAVVQSALYKPLANKDSLMTNKVITSAVKFFRKLAFVFIGYIIILICTYPFLVNNEFSAFFSISLIVIISISSFVQYYFGIVDGLLLNADQRGYVSYTIQILTTILNMLFCVFFINAGYSIHIVKIFTSCIYIFRPIITRIYVNKRYKINRKESYTVEPISQKWNGIAQHIAAIVVDYTDTVILTIFSNISYVSIYSVYSMVIMGIRQLIMSSCNGLSSFWGNLLAMKKYDKLKQSFEWAEWLIHTITILIFGCTSILIVPFVIVYTKGVNDANYVQPIFAIILTWAHAMRCLRLPYNLIILAGGHYKQTENNYIIASITNISLSILLVIKYGLIGVAVGTLIALTYQTIWMALYISKNLIFWPIRHFIRQLSVDLIIIIVGMFSTRWITIRSISYISWVFLATKICFVWVFISFCVNFIFYRNWINRLIKLNN